MFEQNRIISEALRRGRHAAIAAEFRRLWWLLALSVIVLLGAIYWNASPRRVVGTVYGVAVGAHQPQTETGQAPLQLSIALDDGGVVAVTLPRGAPYRAKARVEVEVTDRDWPPKASTFRFVRYVDGGSGG